MDYVEMRKDRSKTNEKYLRIVTDYAHGIPLKDIMDRNNLKSPNTVYIAIRRINKLVEESRKVKN